MVQLTGRSLTCWSAGVDCTRAVELYQSWGAWPSCLHIIFFMLTYNIMDFIMTVLSVSCSYWSSFPSFLKLNSSCWSYLSLSSPPFCSHITHILSSSCLEISSSPIIISTLVSCPNPLRSRIHIWEEKGYAVFLIWHILPNSSIYLPVTVRISFLFVFKFLLNLFIQGGHVDKHGGQMVTYERWFSRCESWAWNSGQAWQ